MFLSVSCIFSTEYSDHFFCHSEPFECVTPDSEFKIPAHNASGEGKCFCDDNAYKCEGSPYGAPPEERITTTADILQNLTGRDIHQYLLDSFPEFIQKRYFTLQVLFTRNLVKTFILSNYSYLLIGINIKINARDIKDIEFFKLLSRRISISVCGEIRKMFFSNINV